MQLQLSLQVIIREIGGKVKEKQERKGSKKKLQVALQKRRKQLTEHLFFAIINAEKGIVTRCVENGRLQRKKEEFLWKKHFRQEAFPSGCAFRRS